ncbi:MAG: 23S rRNA (pseudouridine(1915)-N(3))-methyltransferase RlmH [Selenomonadaceae bacterium]|nr:23S rRNA (pseudouridine(1915)-N(3))-methyltransferase RlmH [Selenomonadaceae bacterium]MBQ7492900.1 23S rRNA (pseudouridine(1915)-N(3))-methyltransferase RlmH [Selenomonadaceae bacterium]
MKINFIVVGKLKEKFLVDGVAEYLKRIKKFATIEVREIPECRTVEEEGQKILSLVPQNSWLCVLDVAGAALNSEDFAKKIAALTLDGVSNLTFAIGGAFGLSEELRRAASFRLSLSEMTFTHQMARLILAEQIYRAFKINRHEPYHW